MEDLELFYPKYATLDMSSLARFKGILCDFFIFTLEQIIVLNKYFTYNKSIPKISHVKTLQNLCKMRYKKNKKVVRNKLLKVNSLYFKRRL